MATGNAVEDSVQEIKQWGRSPWAVGVWPFPGMDRPLDHPDMEPIWRAIEEEGLAVIHHSLAWDPPYFPGYRDLWDNLFLGREKTRRFGVVDFARQEAEARAVSKSRASPTRSASLRRPVCRVESGPRRHRAPQAATTACRF